MRPDLTRRAPWAIWLGVVSPLVLVAIALAFRPWIPVLDMAMTELRVRDVGGRHTPLVGLPGRIGRTVQEQGSHPGPISFWLVAPFYRLAGARAWGMELASCVLNGLCVAGLVALGRLRFGIRGALVLGAVAALALRGYGMNVLSHPWNPYFPVLWWLLALVAAWLVLDGDARLAPLVVVTTSVAAQTHVPYLINAIALDAVVLGVLLWRWRKGRDDGRWLGVAAGSGALLWLPPIIEQLVRNDGNIAKLVRHFTSGDHEPAIGLWAATKLTIQHLDWFGLGLDLVRRQDAFVHRAGIAGDPATRFSLGGLLMLGLWIAAAWWAWRRRHTALVALHAVIALTLAVGWASSARIFGKVWYYLTLWMSGTSLLLLLAVLWTAVLLVDELGVTLPGRVPVAVAGATLALATVGSLVTAAGQRPPEEGQGDDVRLVLPELVPLIDRDLRYVVFWQESIVPGSQGYAVLNELERRGFEVGVHPTWHVPATEHRVFREGTYDAELHVVSGGWITNWAADHPGTEALVEIDARTPDERARFDALDARVAQRLTEIGRSDLLDTVETNLFGASLAPGLPADVVADLSEMLLIGEPLVIFRGPPGSTT